MTMRRILLIDADGVTAYRWRRGEAAIEETFAGEDAGQRCAAYLSACRGEVVHLFADLAAEEFHAEEIPALAGEERDAVIRRRREYFFNGVPLAVAWHQGWIKRQRDEELLLFAALLCPQIVEPWLERVTRSEAVLAGLFSVPQVLSAVAAQIDNAPRRFLLATVSRAGVRLSCFDNGRLLFSRLAPLAATASADEAAAACRREAGHLFPFVSGRCLKTGDGPLPVRVLAHPADADIYRQHCGDTAELRFEIADLGALAVRCGLRTPPADSRIDALCVHLLASRPPKAQFAGAPLLGNFRLHRLRQGLRRTAAAALAVCLLLSGWQLAAWRALVGATAEFEMQGETDRRGYEALLARLPALPLPEEKLRLVIDGYRALEAGAPDPVVLSRRLGAAMEASPEIELDRFHWFMGSRKDSEFRLLPTAVAEIQGHLPAPMSRDIRRQIDIVDGFVSRVRADPVVEVRMLTMPFDGGADKSFKSDAPRPPLARFALRVAQR